MAAAVLISIPVAPLGAATGQIQPKQEIRDLVKQFAEAWDNNDAKELAAMVTKDGTFVSPGGDQATSRKEIQRLLTQEHQDIFRGTTLDTNVRSINFPDEGEATVIGPLHVGGI